jgi:lysophospholipase L1-like esterase
MRAFRDGRRAGGSRRGRRHLHLNVVFVLVVGAVSVCLPSVASATEASYVAMGDSYTAGPGITPVSPTAPEGCLQSAANYPHLVASALHLSLTDVSCSGAKTEDFTVSQLPGQPPQFDALTPSTQVVTVGMGGNDGNLFETLVLGCTALDLGQPNVGAPCQEHYESFVKKTFEEFTPAQEAALREIHVLSPKAKVFVVGYPEITPVNGYCPSAIPWTTGDLKWFNLDVQRRGNANIRREAIANGATFVDTFTLSMGHNACEEVGVRWIEPLFGSLTHVPVHPNAKGQQADAFDVGLTMVLHGVL